MPTSTGSQRKQANPPPKKIYFFTDYVKAFDLWITTNCGKFLEMGVPDYLI